MDEKLCRNILIYNISYQNVIGAKPFHIRLVKVNGFVRVYDETRYLVLFGPEIYVAIYNRIRYLINRKGGITYVFSNNYAKIKIDSYDSFPLE